MNLPVSQWNTTRVPHVFPDARGSRFGTVWRAGHLLTVNNRFQWLVRNRKVCFLPVACSLSGNKIRWPIFWGF